MSRPPLIPSRGAIPESLMMEVVRDITPEDILRLGEAPKSRVPVLQKLRAVHHRQAQLLAAGKTPTEVAAIIGCTVQRLVQLQVDPTFVELMSYYHDQMMANQLDDTVRLQHKITDLGEQAVDELLERIEDDTTRKRMHTGDVRKIAEFAMDRTVAPPKATPVVNNAPSAITINFGTQVGPKPHDPMTIEHEPAAEGRPDVNSSFAASSPSLASSPEPSGEAGQTLQVPKTSATTVYESDYDSVDYCGNDDNDDSVD